MSKLRTFIQNSYLLINLALLENLVIISIVKFHTSKTTQVPLLIIDINIFKSRIMGPMNNIQCMQPCVRIMTCIEKIYTFLFQILRSREVIKWCNTKRRRCHEKVGLAWENVIFRSVYFRKNFSMLSGKDPMSKTRRPFRQNSIV